MKVLIEDLIDGKTKRIVEIIGLMRKETIENLTRKEIDNRRAENNKISKLNKRFEEDAHRILMNSRGMNETVLKIQKFLQKQTKSETFSIVELKIFDEMPQF